MSDYSMRESVVKTRKPHRCWGCLEIIPAGTRVWSETSAYDGTVGTIYMCDPCNAYWTSAAFRKRVKDEGWEYDEIEEGQIGVLRKGGEI